MSKYRLIVLSTVTPDLPELPDEFYNLEDDLRAAQRRREKQGYKVVLWNEERDEHIMKENT